MDITKNCNCEELIKKAEDFPFVTGGVASGLALVGIAIYSFRYNESSKIVKLRTFNLGFLTACVILGIGTKFSNDYMLKYNKK